eukprot:1221960-Prymnesium_polylepis.1
MDCCDDGWAHRGAPAPRGQNAVAASICDGLVAAWLLFVAAPRRKGPTLLMPLAVATMDGT